MHENPNDLTALERQLAACRPSAAGLDADAILFAAGQAAARKSGSPVAWPVLAAGFACLSLILGAGLIGERSGRLALADRLNQLLAPVVEAPASIAAPSPQPLPADSYFAIRRSIETSADMVFARADRQVAPLPAPPPEVPILRAWPDLSADLKP
jgi:hypothetical protein